MLRLSDVIAVKKETKRKKKRRKKRKEKRAININFLKQLENEIILDESSHQCLFAFIIFIHTYFGHRPRPIEYINADS